MAFMNQEHKKELAPAIKAVMKKYKMKGSIAVKHYSTLVVNLKEGPLDFSENDNRVYPYNVGDTFTGKTKEFLVELTDAMKGDGWFDKSDIMTDYFHTAYYMEVNVGKWDKPYKVVA